MTAEHNKPKGVDTTRTGEIIFVSDDVPLQTILYSIEDIFGNQVYYTEEAEKYIKDSRSHKRGQKYVQRYLHKIPALLKDPSIVIIDPEDVSESTLLYYKEVYVREKNKQVLFTLVVKVWKERIIYNFYPQESEKVKSREGKPYSKVIHLKKGYKKASYFKR